MIPVQYSTRLLSSSGLLRAQGACGTNTAFTFSQGLNSDHETSREIVGVSLRRSTWTSAISRILAAIRLSSIEIDTLKGCALSRRSHWIEMVAATRRTHGDLLGKCLLLTSVLSAIFFRSSALGPDEIANAQCPGAVASVDRLRCLAQSYAPLLKFDSGEVFFPSSVDDFLPYMKLINADGSDIPNQPHLLQSSNLVYTSATPLTTFLTTKKFLIESEIDPLFMLGRKPSNFSTVPIYTSIVRKEAGVLYDFVYYTFYPYNQGKPVGKKVLGNHVGDWEYVTLRIGFRNSPYPQLLQAFTSQHSGGECLTPSNITFVVDTPHPVIYVARGSHGTYNKPGRTVYLRIPELGIELADDHYGTSAVEWATWNNVAVRVEGQPLADNYRWWGYNGRWGNREGPTSALGQFVLENGPAYPGIHGLTFQLDLPAFESCPVL